MQIDGLRCIAITGVLLQHFLPKELELIKSIPLGAGVHLFFVISGYLITKILLTNRDRLSSSHGKRRILFAFFYKRILRIFPIYYILLIFLLLIGFQNVYDVWGWVATYSSNIYQALKMPYIGSFNHMWSLAVEEQFYLFWPFLILLIPRNHTEKVIFSLIIASLFFKIIYWCSYGPGPAITTLVISCGDTLGFGALVAYLQLYKPKVLVGINKVPFIVFISFLPFAFLVVFPLGPKFISQALSNFIFSLFAFTIVCKAAEQSFKYPVKFILESKLVIYIGKISYGIYLYHLFMPDLYNQFRHWFPNQFQEDSWYKIPFLFASSAVIAIFSWNLIEKPVLKLKNKVKYVKENA